MMSPFFAFRFDITKPSRTYDVLVIFVATAKLDPDAFATVIQEEIRINLVPDKIITVVRDVGFDIIKSELENDSLHKATIARLNSKCAVTLAGYDLLGQETRQVNIEPGPSDQPEIDFDDFKRRGITRIFNNRHGFVESTPTYHFENPSGRHTERFIRLSNILARGAEIAFIGFCTLPTIPMDATSVYIDTPSLFAVVATINDQRLSFSSEPLIADNFASYSGVNDYQFQRPEESYVLISASSSGSLAVQLAGDQGFDPSQIAHLLFLGEDKSDSRVVCDLQFHEDENPEGFELRAVESSDVCRMCASGSFAIKLQGDQFEFAGPQQEPLEILKTYAPKSLSQLMRRTAGTNIYGVVAGTTPQSRQFDIDPEKLLANTEFKKRLDYLMRRSLPASLSHVIALDSASMPLATEVANFHAQEPRIVIERKNLTDIPKNTSTAIVIVASVVESGRSLLELSRDLRSIVPEAPLLYLVGLSKSNGEPRRSISLAKTLVQTTNPYPYQFIEIEKMVLPYSRDNRSWAEELKLWSAIKNRAPGTLLTTIETRIGQLRKTSVPLREELFISNTPEMSLELQPGFVFWPRETSDEEHSDADVFFTIASVLQQLRANARQPDMSGAIKSNWFQQTILAPENFGRFNDDIIQASFLRAAYPREMNYGDAPSESREMGRLIQRIIKSSDSPRGGAAAEFLLAIATNRLQLCRSDRDEVLNTASNGSELVDFLQSHCRSPE